SSREAAATLARAATSSRRARRPTLMGSSVWAMAYVIVCPCNGSLAGDLREIGDKVHRIAQAGQKVEPVGANGRIGVVDEDLFEEGIDRRAQAGKHRNRAGVVVALEVPGDG